MAKKYVRVVPAADAQPAPEGQAVAEVVFVDADGNPVDLVPDAGAGDETDEG